MSAKRPLYARALRLRHIRPGGLLCFAFFEGAVAVGILLALAELAPWWAALVVPVAVAAMVKVNDIVAGLSARARLIPAHTRAGTARRAGVPRARSADTPPPVNKTQARGRADALPAADLPDRGTRPGHVYRYRPDTIDPAGRTADSGSVTETDGLGEHRRGLNEGRFDQP